MNVTDILKPECVLVPLKATEPTAAITELVDLLAANQCVSDRDEVLDAILAREQKRPTGIEHGLAAPHGKCRGCAELVMAVGKPATPIDFGARDGKRSVFVMLLASPIDKTGPHIQALARIGRIWQMAEFRADVEAAGDAQALFDAIRRPQR